MESDSTHAHLKRLTNVFQENPIYFITCCCKRRLPTLNNSIANEILVDEWQNSRERHGWCIGKYVIMPDHVHFLASPNAEAKSLSQFMQAWKQWTSKRITSALSIEPIWQKEFFDHLLRNDESLSEKWDYIHNNPIRANLVSCSNEWQYQGYVHFR